MHYMLITQSNIYNRQLQSAGDAYGHPLDMVAIVHARQVVSKVFIEVAEPFIITAE